MHTMTRSLLIDKPVALSPSPLRGQHDIQSVGLQIDVALWGVISFFKGLVAGRATSQTY
jgi:hypothetical protein